MADTTLANADPNGAALDGMRPSRQEEGQQIITFKGWFKNDAAHSADWRKQAKEDFDFVAGDQWSETDKTVLSDQSRPVIVFNRTLTLIKAVAGMEINGRHEISFLPRGTEDAKVNELLSAGSKWMADNCDGEDEESAAFQHAMICGMGINEHRLDYEEDPQGKYIEEAIDPLEFYWDRTARKKNLAGARRMWRVRKMPLGDAMQMFPGTPEAPISEEDLDAKWAASLDSASPTKTREEKYKRDENSSVVQDSNEVTLVEVQWWEREPYWLLVDPQTNRRIELSDDEYALLSERLKEVEALNGKTVPVDAEKMFRRVYKRAFLGNKVLKIGPAPISQAAIAKGRATGTAGGGEANPDRFSWTVITGELHHNKGYFYGLIRVMRDPQMWANKWLSQSLHILNTTAKGGVLVEKGVFDNQEDAEKNYARPESLTVVAKGALSGQTGPKIIPKPGAAFPTGHIQLMEFAISALRDVTGINLELLGLKDINQPGILEAQRKQAGMTVLATLFDSLRRSRKMVGRIRLYYLQNFLSDGRWIRIVGPEGAQSVQLLRDKTIGIYDVEVDDTPTSPNQKQANWAIIQPMLAAFKDQLIERPDIFAIILDYSPLPSRVVEAIKTAIQKPDPDAAKNKALAEADLVAGINQKQSVAELNNAKAGATQATAVYDIAMADNLLKKNNGQLDSVREALDNEQRLADIAKTHQDAAHTAAKTETEKANAHRAKIGGIIDALTPIPHSDPHSGGPAQPKKEPAKV